MPTAARPALRIALVAAALALAPALEPLAAAAPPAPAAPAGAPDPGARRVAARRRTGPVAVDGRLDEADWAAAAAGRGFWQRNPDEGKPPRFATEFRVLYDDRAIYVGVWAFDPEPGRIRGRLTRRDDDGPSDTIQVAIDSYHDHRTAFAFVLNAAGVQRDLLLFDDTSADASWNAVWQGATALTAGGWTAEFRIPLSQLRFARADEQTWGLQVQRTVDRTKEETYWAPVPRAAARTVGLAGDLTDLRGLRPASHVELLPYAVTGVHLLESGAARDVEGLAGLGLDAKYGLTSNLTLDATLNPDFGQVEADPSEVNLTAYETYFAEKRPFFLEGMDIYRFPVAPSAGAAETLFYSRRIGARPTGSPAGHEVVEGPDRTTIYGAAKLTGKVGDAWSIGALTALTARETAATDDGSGALADETVEPLASFGILRLAKDFAGGRASLGLAATSVLRDLEGTGFEPRLADRAFAGGVQYSQLLLGSAYKLQLRLFGSQVHGSAEAIDRQQRSSRRYFQRPDAGHVTYDPTRTSLAGYGLNARFSKEGGEHVTAGVQADVRSPGLELNDLGYQRRADVLQPQAWLTLKDETPGRAVRSWSVEAAVWPVMDFEPRLNDTGVSLWGAATLLNYWGAAAGGSVDLNRWSPGTLRGGPALREDPVHDEWVELWSDGRKDVVGTIGAETWRQPASGLRGYATWASATVRPRSNLDLSVGLNGNARRDGLVYVTTAEDAAGAPRYVVAGLDQDTLALTLRLNYTVTPTLSLQLYAQPFLSVGSYVGFREAVRPTAAAFADRYQTLEPVEADGALRVDADGDGAVDYAFDVPDFSFRELRSNAVVRWEYRPGSALFVVWSQGRTRVDTSGRLRPGRDLEELIGADGEHVLLVKLSYWMGT